MKVSVTFVGGLVLVLLVCGLHAAIADNHIDPELTEVWQPEPAIVSVDEPGQPPSDAIVLLGEDLSAWRGWSDDNDGEGDCGSGDASWTMEDGVATVRPGAGCIQTKQSFGSVQLHVEWRTPHLETEGQLKANSGIFLQKRYEIQVLDSFGNRTYSNGQAASIYKQSIPLVNASRPPATWQTYDIIFSAPEFAADGTLEKPAFVTVLHNGVLVQNHVEILGNTEYRGAPSYTTHGEAPLALQDHGDLVSFRNIWIREL